MPSQKVILNAAFDAEGRLTVRVVGPISHTNAGELGRQLQGLVDEGHLRIRLDLGRVSAVDAVALGVLARLHVDLLQRGGGLTLTRVPAAVVDEIELGGRASVFEIER